MKQMNCILVLVVVAMTASNTSAENPPGKKGCYAWLPRYRCFFADYNCKPAPPVPCDGYCETCDVYCKKPMPCPPPSCLKWLPDCYCPKPPVQCFPLDPCRCCK